MTSKKPVVSICIPNRNTRPFLDERKNSIQLQTLHSYEVIIVDDGSTDGAVEFFQEWARTDNRIRFIDGPRKGLYAGWNACLRHCTGEFVYFATSDDSMLPHALKHMAEMLHANPDCDICYTPLIITNASGEPTTLPDGEDRNRKITPEWSIKPHLRPAPIDGVLSLCGTGQYGSITQLLFRRRLFSLVGDFRTDLGPSADYEWTLRASLRANTVYSPLPCGTWRVHGAQATSQNDGGKLKLFQEQLRMIPMAIKAECGLKCRLPRKACSLASFWSGVKMFREIRKQESSFHSRASQCLMTALRHPALFGGFALTYLIRRNDLWWRRKLFEWMLRISDTKCLDLNATSQNLHSN